MLIRSTRILTYFFSIQLCLLNCSTHAYLHFFEVPLNLQLFVSSNEKKKTISFKCFPCLEDPDNSSESSEKFQESTPPNT